MLDKTYNEVDYSVVEGKGLFQQMLEKAIKEWNEADHPREPSGSSEGGQFASANGMTSVSQANEEQKARLKKLRVPPAWTDVQISADPAAALQVTGRDSKGRLQYRYSADHSERQSAEKFARLKEFSAIVPQIEKAALQDMRKGNDTAAAAYLIAQTGFRPGSDAETGGAVKAYGATTLEGRHIRVEGDSIEFGFVGKKGVTITKTIKDKDLASYIRKRAVGSADRLFRTNDSSLRDYVKSISGDKFKVKDFRTYHGTSVAIKAIGEELKAGSPKTIKEQKAAEKRVATRVAQHLGNTPAIARAAYIDPSVWGRLQPRAGA